MLHKGEETFIVQDEQEEFEAGLKGYERHRDPEVNKREKGTDREIIRVNPELEKKRLEDEKAAKFSAELVEVAKKAIEDDKKANKKETPKKEPIKRGKKAKASKEEVKDGTDS